MPSPAGQRLGGAVEHAVRVAEAAGHRQHAAGMRVERDDRALDLGGLPQRIARLVWRGAFGFALRRPAARPTTTSPGCEHLIDAARPARPDCRPRPTRRAQVTSASGRVPVLPSVSPIVAASAPTSRTSASCQPSRPSAAIELAQPRRPLGAGVELRLRAAPAVPAVIARSGRRAAPDRRSPEESGESVVRIDRPP